MRKSSLFLIVMLVLGPQVAFPQDVQTKEVTTEDDQTIEFAYRIPASVKEPSPTIVFIHGGARKVGIDPLKKWLNTQKTELAFFERGYICVEADYRTYKEAMRSKGPILDCKAVVEEVKKIPLVDPDKIILYGGSGGGSITFELISLPIDVAAAVVGEPAFLIYCGLIDKREGAEKTFDDPFQYYTEERKAVTRAKMSHISVPLLIIHSDVHRLNSFNDTILKPELTAMKKPHEVWFYPDLKHGFYWGKEDFINDPTFRKMIAAADDFIRRSLNHYRGK